MTPTLKGRWSTRILLTIFVGIPIGIIYGDLLPIFLMYLFGVIWDYFFSKLQDLRWDNDWPPVLILSQLVWEGIFLWAVLNFIFFMKDEEFWYMYGAFALITLILQLGVLNIFFPYRRFKGGKI